MESEALHGWLLKFVEYSKILRTSVETFFDWTSNHIPPWTSYSPFMSGRLVALNKRLGICPVGIGENKQHFFAKCMLRVMGLEPTNVCQDNQLCAGLKAGIERYVLRVQYIWGTNSSMEDWGFLKVDAKNVFNEINRIGMLWTVCHLWSSGACFVLNCYCHCLSLLLRNGNGAVSFLHSREGVEQGEPFAVVDYGIGVLLITKHLKATHTDVTQP